MFFAFRGPNIGVLLFVSLLTVGNGLFDANNGDLLCVSIILQMIYILL